MSDHFEPKLYVAFARAGGKAYETQRLMYDLLVSGYELKPMNVKKENNMNDIEFTNLHVKNILNGVIGAKPPKQPVMSKHIIGKGRWQEPEIILKSSWDGDEVNGVMATFRKDIYAKVVDTTDKAIVDAVIDFARSEGFTDVYLIDKTYIMAALESKQLQDELERDLEEGQKLLEDRKTTIEQLVYERDRLLRDLKDAEERNNIKDAQIKTQAETISRYREDNKELTAANEDLNDRIKKMDKKLRDHEGNNSDNNIVIEYQKRKIHELECQLRKYKVAGMFIKASLAAAEDPEGK